MWSPLFFPCLGGLLVSRFGCWFPLVVFPLAYNFISSYFPPILGFFFVYPFLFSSHYFNGKEDWLCWFTQQFLFKDLLDFRHSQRTKVCIRMSFFKYGVLFAIPLVYFLFYISTPMFPTTYSMNFMDHPHIIWKTTSKKWDSTEYTAKNVCHHNYFKWINNKFEWF